MYIPGLNSTTPVTVSGPGSPQFRTSWLGNIWGAYGTTDTLNRGYMLQLSAMSPATTGQEYAITVTIGTTPYIWKLRTVQAATKTIFVTSTRYNGNLGGFSGADSLCQTRATAAGLGSNFYALIGGLGVNAFDRIPWNWNRLDNRNGNKVADYLWDLEELGTANLARVNRNESNGTVITNTEVWTGMIAGIDSMTDNDEPRNDSGGSCANQGSSANGAWTSNSSSDSGATGDANFDPAIDSWSWMNNAAWHDCSQQFRLYCVGPFGASDR